MRILAGLADPTGPPDRVACPAQPGDAGGATPKGPALAQALGAKRPAVGSVSAGGATRWRRGRELPETGLPNRVC
jgi:hypothetical protein